MPLPKKTNPRVGQRIQHSRTSPTLSRSVARKYSQPRPAFQSGTIVGCRMLTIVSSCSRAQSSINRCPRRRETMLKTMAKLTPRTAQMPNRIQISVSLNDEIDVGIACGLTKKAEPPPTRDVNRDSGTASANGVCFHGFELASEGKSYQAYLSLAGARLCPRPAAAIRMLLRLTLCAQPCSKKL